MRYSKDTVNSPVSEADRNTICDNLATLDVTHISFSTPMDYVSYASNWVASIRQAGKSVWFRGSINTFEGIYSESRVTPKTSPAIALGTASEVLAGTDTSSYLYKAYNFIKTNPTLFENGDIWGVYPEPENQEIGTEANKMFNTYAELGQWLVDLKTVSDSAFTDIGKTVTTGMTSLNGYTVKGNYIGSTYLSQIGRVTIDHYVAYAGYITDFDTIHTNAGVDVYIGEMGLCSSLGVTASEKPARLDEIMRDIYSRSFIKGINYFQARGYTNEEDIMEADYSLNDTAYVLQDYFMGTAFTWGQRFSSVVPSWEQKASIYPLSSTLWGTSVASDTPYPTCSWWQNLVANNPYISLTSDYGKERIVPEPYQNDFFNGKSGNKLF
jgi:hypothetical protein